MLRFKVKEFKTFYSLFLVKFVQDMIINHYINGSYCLVKLRNQQSSKSTSSTSLIERMSIKMNEIFFSRPTSTDSDSSTCKPLNCLSSKSIRSNQACNNKRVSLNDLVGEILKYGQIESSSSVATFVKNKIPDLTFLQCSLCFTLLDDHPDQLKMHIINTHVYNETLNKCMVCCYCR